MNYQMPPAEAIGDMSSTRITSVTTEVKNTFADLILVGKTEIISQNIAANAIAEMTGGGFGSHNGNGIFFDSVGPIDEEIITNAISDSMMTRFKNNLNYIISEVTANPIDFLGGLLETMGANIAFDLPRKIIELFDMEPEHNVAYYTGRLVGDIVSFGIGVTEIIGGITMEGGAIAVSATGVGALGGLALSNAGVVTIAHGGSVIALSTKNFVDDFKKLDMKLSSTNGSKEISESLINKIKSKNLPTDGEINFAPKGNELIYSKELKGYIDKHGNIWRKGPYHGDPNLGFQFEWDVELSKKGINMWGDYLKSGKNYINVRPDGFISH